VERELILLGLLRRQEMHGYRLAEIIDRTLGTCIDLKKATAYYLLEKMSRAGWLERRRHRSGNRPSRWVYALTGEGERIFQQGLRRSLSEPGRPPFLSSAGMAFLDDLPKTEAHQLLTRRLQAVQQACDLARSAPEHHASMQLVLEHHLRHLEEEVAWLTGLLQEIARPGDSWGVAEAGR
jgi:DNA-binding PadR family transcriptional regulator